MDQYKVRPLGQIVKTVSVPGSKSMTNRALFMASMAGGISVLSGILISDDSKVFLESLKEMGFMVTLDEEHNIVTLKGQNGMIPAKNPSIYVGSAGTAARFLTSMLALSDTEATIQCSEQMKARPMGPLFHALEKLGAEFTYLGRPEHLPVIVKGRSVLCHNNEVDLDISESTQFLSALLMSAPLLQEGLNIHITSDKKTGAYIKITQKMMEEFGVSSEFLIDSYKVSGEEHYITGRYQIEPDVSAACYFYAAAALTGSSIQVRNVHFDSMQGDIQFLHLLQKMGCDVTEEADGVRVTGRKDLNYKAVNIDMNDFSDQAITLAAMAPYLNGVTRICNVGHIRKQESDRMHAIVTELRKTGITCYEEGDDIVIHSGIPKPAVIETYDDHRMSMGFSLLGLRTPGIVIEDPKCCSKTFKNYYSVLESLYE